MKAYRRSAPRAAAAFICGVPKAAPTRKDRITPGDEALLTWYFGEGQSCFERSPFGALLDRQELFAYAMKPCSRCGGLGFTDADLRASTRALADARAEGESKLSWTDVVEAAEPKCAKCGGQGIVDGEEERLSLPQHHREPCGACRGCGREVTGDLCRRCGGSGATGGYTVLVRVNHDEWEKSEPHDGHLRRYAVASRRLGRMIPLHIAVLDKYYGPIGAYYGSHQFGQGRSAKILGRTHAVYELTQTGRKITKILDNEHQNPLKLKPCQLLATVVLNQLQQPLEGRQDAVDRMREQANQLLSAAARTWNSSK